MRTEKLKLHRETLRRLDNRDLARVGGADTHGPASCGPVCTAACTIGPKCTGGTGGTGTDGISGCCPYSTFPTPGCSAGGVC
jgi:hypothetical protein